MQVSAQNLRRSAKLTVEWDDEVYLSWEVASTILLNAMSTDIAANGGQSHALAAPGGDAAVSLAAAVLPGAVPDHPEDQPRGSDRGAAAIHAAARLGRAAVSPACRGTFDNYAFLFQDGYYGIIYLASLKMAAIGTLLCLLLGYPMAYFIARQPARRRQILLLAVILPFWISFLLRVYAWIGLLNNRGVINEFLLWLGVIDQPLTMLYNDFAVYLGIVYSYLPFMILPLYANLERLDLDLLDAAADLGARRWQVFVDVTLPLSVPGIIGGCLLVFIPAVGEFMIPALLGGADTLMIGRVLWDEFFINRDWPVASAVSVVLLLLLVAPIMWFQRLQSREQEAAR